MGNIKMSETTTNTKTDTTTKTTDTKTKTDTKPATTTKTPAKGGNTMLWIIIALVVVAVIGVAVYFMTKKKQPEATTDKTAATGEAAKEGGDIELYFAKDL